VAAAGGAPAYWAVVIPSAERLGSDTSSVPLAERPGSHTRSLPSTWAAGRSGARLFTMTGDCGSTSGRGASSRNLALGLGGSRTADRVSDAVVDPSTATGGAISVSTLLELFGPGSAGVIGLSGCVRSGSGGGIGSGISRALSRAHLPGARAPSRACIGSGAADVGASRPEMPSCQLRTIAFVGAPHRAARP